jgi:hypothetical protein
MARSAVTPRPTPVCDGLDGDVFWLAAQRGRGAGWVRNIQANLARRLCVGASAAMATDPLTVPIDLDPR